MMLECQLILMTILSWKSHYLSIHNIDTERFHLSSLTGIEADGIKLLFGKLDPMRLSQHYRHHHSHRIDFERNARAFLKFHC